MVDLTDDFEIDPEGIVEDEPEAGDIPDDPPADGTSPIDDEEFSFKNDPVPEP
jgi:hypothetical protein